MSHEEEEARCAADLVARIQADDRAAEGELVERYSRGISYLLRHLTSDPSSSEDLHQETFRIVLEKVRTNGILEPEKLVGFVRGTARNLVRAEIRKRRRRPIAEALDDQAEPDDPSPGPLSQVLREEDKLRVRRLLGELGSERDRQILYRFHIAEESKAEICRTLGLDSLQFNTVLFRARRRFRKLVEAELK